MIPFDQLPRLYNPPSGKLVTANNKVVGDDYAHFLGVEYDPGWRAARIEELLQQKERFTLRDMEAMQLDTLSKYAQALVPWLTLINSEEPWEKTVLTQLRKWNLRLDAELDAPTVFHHYLIALLDLVYGDKLGESYRGYLGVSSNPLFLVNGFMLRAEQHLLALLHEHETSFWYTNIAKGKARDREELLSEALTQAARSIRATAGDSTRRWAWGRAHQLRYVHPLGSARLLKNLFNRGPFPVSGDATTINMARHTPQLPLGLVQVIAGYRQIYEVGVWDRAETITSLGQSGHPLSPHYDDQILLWREGLYHAMPWSAEAVANASVYHLRLQPGATAEKAQ
jgi:penicillin amidase